MKPWEKDWSQQDSDSAPWDKGYTVAETAEPDAPDKPESPGVQWNARHGLLPKDVGETLEDTAIAVAGRAAQLPADLAVGFADVVPRAIRAVGEYGLKALGEDEAAEKLRESITPIKDTQGFQDSYARGKQAFNGWIESLYSPATQEQRNEVSRRIEAADDGVGDLATIVGQAVEGASAMAANPRALSTIIGQSIPDLLVGMGAAKATETDKFKLAYDVWTRIGANPKMSATMAAKAQARASQLAKAQRKKGAAAAAGTESFIASQYSADEVAAEIENTSDDELLRLSPRYAAMREQGATEAQAKTALRSEAVDIASALAGVTSLASLGVTGAAGMQAKAVQRLSGRTAKEGGDSIIEAGVKGAAREGAQEFLQEGGQKVAENTAIRESGVDPTRKHGEGAVAHGAAGAVAGGVIGGPLGAVADSGGGEVNVSSSDDRGGAGAGPGPAPEPGPGPEQPKAEAAPEAGRNKPGAQPEGGGVAGSFDEAPQQDDTKEDSHEASGLVPATDRQGAVGEGAVEGGTQRALDRVRPAGGAGAERQSGEDAQAALPAPGETEPVRDGADKPVQALEAPKQLEAEANEAATSPKNDLPQPTQAQLEAGVYKMGRPKGVHGLPISIENPRGSERKGTGPDGREWTSRMHAHYGYIRGTQGKDKDHLDIFLTDDAPHAQTAYVIDQKNADGSFDEHKIVLGPRDEADARQAYLANYEEGWDGIGAITAMSVDGLKEWMKGDTTKPVAYKPVAKPAKTGELIDGDSEPAELDAMGRAVETSEAADHSAPEESQKDGNTPAEASGDWMDALFGTPEEQRERAEAEAKDADALSAATEKSGRLLDEAIASHEAEHADWSGRQYKAHGGSVEVDDAYGQSDGKRNVGKINEARRQRRLAEISEIIGVLKRAKDSLAKGPQAFGTRVTSIADDIKKHSPHLTGQDFDAAVDHAVQREFERKPTQYHDTRGGRVYSDVPGLPSMSGPASPGRVIYNAASSVSDPESRPDEQSIVPDGPAEVLKLERKNASASIRVLQIAPDKWISAAGYDYRQGDHRGLSTPLTSHKTHPDRQAAINDAARQIIDAARSIEAERAGMAVDGQRSEAKKVAAWAESLVVQDAKNLNDDQMAALKAEISAELARKNAEAIAARIDLSALGSAAEIARAAEIRRQAGSSTYLAAAQDAKVQGALGTDKVDAKIKTATRAAIKAAIADSAEPDHKTLKALQKELLADPEYLEAVKAQAARAKAAAEAESGQDRGAYGLALKEAMDSAQLSEGDDVDFKRGFDHALAGRTKSTISGDATIAGYTAGREWAKTDEGKPFFKGKSRGKKLENTGAKLVRWFDKQRDSIKGLEGDHAQQVLTLVKIADRGRLFKPDLSEATPGAVRFFEWIRGEVAPFKSMLYEGTPSLRIEDWRGNKRSFERDLAYTLRNQESEESDAMVRRWSMQAEQYVEFLQKMTGALSGAKTVDDMGKGLAALFYGATLPDFARATLADGLMPEILPLAREFLQTTAFGSATSYSLRDMFRLAGHGITVPEDAPGRLLWRGERFKEDEASEGSGKTKAMRRPKLDHITRTGLKDYRGGKDITPAQFKAKFGLADVGFGGWVGSKQDQDHLNYAYDAFMDLAAGLGVEPKVLSMGGALHFTIGALGHGRHSAHYQPKHPHPEGGTVPVINVTNTRGDGTVAHEWAHALDFALMGADPEYKRTVRPMLLRSLRRKRDDSAIEKVRNRFIRGGWHYSHLKNQPKSEHLRHALQSGSYRDGIETSYHQEAVILGKDYWANDEEMIARAFEAYMFDKLAAKAGVNDYLVSDWVEDGKVTKKAGYRGAAYPEGDERTGFAEIWNEVLAAIEWTSEGPRISKDGLDRLAALRREADARFAALVEQAVADARQEGVDAESTGGRDQEAAELIAEQERRDKLRAELEAEDSAGPDAVTSDGPLTDDELDALFDEAMAELDEERQERPVADAPEPQAGPKARPSGESKAGPRAEQKPEGAEAFDAEEVARLAAEAAKLGVKGIGDALKGLHELFGGNKLSSFPGGLDEDTYNKAKPHFQAALDNFIEAGKTLKDLFKYLGDNFGAGIKPYAKHFAKEQGLQRKLAPQQEEANVSQTEGASGNDRASDTGQGPGDAQVAQGGGPAGDGGSQAGQGGAGDVSGAGLGNERGEVSGDSQSAAGAENSGPASTDSGGKRGGAGGGAGVPNGRNYNAEPGSLTRQGSWLETATRNLDIIQLVNDLEALGKPATAEHQLLLAKFTGWGASEIAQNLFPTFVNGGKPGWREQAERARKLLSRQEIAAARRTTQYGHYTSETVIRAIWGGLEHMGFSGGRILEPGMGIGLFPAAAPKAIMDASRYTGIEFDPLTARIGAQLMQRETVMHGDYTKTKLPPDFFDLAIGNPPFRKGAITHDPEYASKRLALHDYFIAKTIDRVRPGGLAVLVTSRFTMDKGQSASRKYLSERADLLGAIRLPNDAFKANAGTEVVTDILIFRRRAEGEPLADPSWTALDSVEAGDESALVNAYFKAHPDMVLGTHAMTGSMYRAAEYTVQPIDGADLAEQLKAAFARLPAGAYQAKRAQQQQRDLIEKEFNPKEKKEGLIYVNDAGKVLGVLDGVGVSLEEFQDKSLTTKDVAWLKDYVGLRDKVKQALYDQRTDGEWEKSLKATEKSYDAFVKKHGRILDFKRTEKVVYDKDIGEDRTDITTRYKNAKRLSVDIESPLVEQLEKEKDGEIVKGDFFKGRTTSPPREPVIESTADALAVSLSQRGRLDIEHVATLAGKPADDVISELGDLVYEAPGGTHVLAEEYLSGRVVDKLEEAETAALIEPRYERNVKALLKVQPKQLAPSQIYASLGAAWITTNYYEQFAREVLGKKTDIHFVPEANAFDIEGAKQRGGGLGEEWGTPDKSPLNILDAVMHNRTIKITRTDSDKKTYVDKEATAAANEKARAMRDKFASWVWSDAERAEALAAVYNRRFNDIVGRKFDGEHLLRTGIPGLALKFKLHPHQLRAIWRVITTGNTYLNHAVGAGKTLEMIVSGMEMRRLGKIRRPMYVVPKHMLKQFAGEFLEAYPLANIMVADDQRFDKANRGRFIAQVTMNDPDAVIMSHPSFTRLSVRDETRAAVASRFIDDLKLAIESMEGGDRFTRKQLEAQLERLENRFDTKASAEGKDGVVDFEDLGVDFLFMDEAHEYRKLDFVTMRGNTKGISPQGSARALDLFIKTQYLESMRPGRSMVFASGTPVVNTMAELFSIQRFMNIKALDRDGLGHFDAWSSQFGQAKIDLEQNAAGAYVFVERFASFLNVPELMSRVREFMDVLTSSQLGDLVKRPDVIGGQPELVITPLSDGLDEYMSNTLTSRIEASMKWKPSPGEPGNPDPLINIITDGRLSALDLRFVDSSLTDDPDSKLNAMLDRIIDTKDKIKGNVYVDKDGKAEPIKGGTQIVFSAVGFGKEVAKSRGFDVRAAIIGRLTKGGYKPGQIAFMGDYDTDAKKSELFKKMRAGEVTILFGSPQNMGTGVNVQKRLAALHFLSPPWFPADVEQPLGRIIRQGNENPEVSIFWYATKGTYDSTMWQMVARKAKFIEQAFLGNAEVRKLDDVSESSQYEMASALASGDERAIQLAGLNSDVERLGRLRHAHASEQQELRSTKRSLQAKIERAEGQLGKLEKASAEIGTVEDLSYTPSGGEAIDPGTKSGEALLGQAKAKLNDWNPTADDIKARRFPSYTLGTMAEGRVKVEADMVADALKGAAKVRKSMSLTMIHPGGVETSIEWDITPESVDNMAASGLGRKLAARVNDLPARISHTRGEIAQQTAELARITKAIGAPFQYEQEFFDKSAEAERLKAELDTGSDDKGAEDQVSEGGAGYAVAKTNTPAFRRWFGDSKVVDENGEPLVVYHGTRFTGRSAAGADSTTVATTSRKEIEQSGFPFSEFRIGRGAAIYFTPRRDYATVYGDSVGAFYLQMRNPLDVLGNPEHRKLAVQLFNEDGGWAFNEDVVDERDGRTDFDSEVDSSWELLDQPGFAERIKGMGFDGFIGDEASVGEPPIPSYAVFDPTQIKSATGNRGNYSPSDPSIVAMPQGPAYAGVNEQAASYATDAQGRLSGRARSGVRGVTLIAGGIKEQIAHRGAAPLIGQKVETLEKLAEAAQILRSPHYETLRYIFLKGDQIVYVASVSARGVASAAAFPSHVPKDERMNWLRDQMKSFGADSYMLLHNHPSGNPQPSRADIRLTERIAAEVEGFRGHVIINSGKFATIKVEGGSAEADIRDLSTPGKDNREPAVASAFLGRRLSNPNDLASIAKAIEQREDIVVLAGRDSTGKLAAMLEVPAAKLAGQVWAKAAMRRLARRHGVREWYMIGSSSNLFAARAGRLIETGFVVDAMSFDGVSMRVSGAAFAPDENIDFTASGNGGSIVAEDVAPYSAEHDGQLGLTDETKVQAFQRKIQDKFNRVMQVQRLAESAGRELADKADPYEVEQLFYGKTDDRLKVMEKLYLDPIVDLMAEHGLSLEQVDKFLYAKHAPEANEEVAKINPGLPDGGSGMDTQDAEDYLNSLSTDERAQLEEIAAIVYRMNADKLRILERMELVDPDEIELWRRRFKFYVPLKSDIDPNAHGTGMGFDIRGRESKQRLGRRSMASSPLLNSTRDFQRAVIRAGKAEVGRAFYELVKAHPDLKLADGRPLWEIRAPKQFRKKALVDVKVTHPVTGEETNAKEVQWVFDRAFSMQDDVFAVKVGGRQHWIYVNDPVLARQLKNLGDDKMHEVVRAIGRGTRLLSSLHTGLNPEFWISNFSRDLQTALIHLSDVNERRAKSVGIKRQVAKDVLSPRNGLMRALVRAELDHEVTDPKQTEWLTWIRDFERHGGKVGFYGLKDITALAKEFDKKLMKAGGEKAGIKQFKQFLAATEAVNSAFENILRVATYRRLVEAKVSRQKAAVSAKNLTVNFNKKGELSGHIGAFYMFFNPAVQGTARMGRALRDSKSVRYLAGAAGLFGVFAALWNELLGADDEDKDEKKHRQYSDYTKNTNFMLVDPVTGDLAVKAPLAYGYNIFYSIGYRATESLLNPDAGLGSFLANVASTAATSFDPIGLSSSVGFLFSDDPRSALPAFSPSLSRPLVEVAVNRNFLGNPIYPEKMFPGDDKPDSERAWMGTPEHWKWLARAANTASGGDSHESGLVSISPETLEHLWKSYIGGAGRFYTGVGSVAADTVQGQAPERVNEVPFVRKVLGEAYPSYGRGRYYDIRRQMDVQKRRIADKTIPASERLEARKRWGSLLKTLDRAESHIKLRRQFLDATKDEAKREKYAAQIEDQMNRVIKAYNQLERGASAE